MKKKFFKGISLLTSLAILSTSFSICLVFYLKISAQTKETIQLEAQSFSIMDSSTALPFLENVSEKIMRVTLISPDGKVLYDNLIAAETLSNHLNRQEIQEALSSGQGESWRFSESLGASTYYYAVRLKDGNILRTSKPVNTVWKLYFDVLPLVIIIMGLFLLIGFAFSKYLARKITSPLEQANLSINSEIPYDELAPFVRNLTRGQQQITEDNERLKSRSDTINAIMDNLDEGVVLLDEYGKILSINKSVSKVFEVTHSMEGRSFLELLRVVEVSENIQKALDGTRCEMIFKKNDHEYRILMSPVPKTGVIILFLDITERARVNRMRREFSANVSHELKTPLTSIYGLAEMLQENVVQEEDKAGFYGKIVKESSRLLQLIEDIILISRLDEEDIEEQFTSVPLQEIAQECAVALERKAEKQKFSINISGKATVIGNYSLLYELFYNLMDNAIKYSVPPGKLEVTLSETNQEVTIVFLDNGIGITEADQMRIFERFYRADKSRSKKYGGTGLGLAIVKHVVLTHDGRIAVNSELGNGSEFIIHFQKKEH